jgi:hypothetical protein
MVSYRRHGGTGNGRRDASVALRGDDVCIGTDRGGTDGERQGTLASVVVGAQLGVGKAPPAAAHGRARLGVDALGSAGQGGVLPANPAGSDSGRPGAYVVQEFHESQGEAGGILESDATTVTAQHEAHFRSALDAVPYWRRRAPAEAERLRARGTPWHLARARGVLRDPYQRLADCGRSGVRVGCACATVVAPVPCRSPLCPHCERRAQRRLRARAHRGMAAAQAAEHARWLAAGRPRGLQPRWSLWTWGTRHTGDLDADRARLQRTWARLRAVLQKRWRRSFPFLRTWEVTQGQDGMGHVHLHIVILAPWIDYRVISRALDRASGGSTVSWRAEGGTRHVSARAAVRYITKYVTKAGTSVTGPLLGQWLWVSRGRRAWSSSRRLLMQITRTPQVCECCGDLVRVQGYELDRPTWRGHATAQGPPWTIQACTIIYEVPSAPLQSWHGEICKLFGLC